MADDIDSACSSSRVSDHHGNNIDQSKRSNGGPDTFDRKLTDHLIATTTITTTTASSLFTLPRHQSTTTSITATVSDLDSPTLSSSSYHRSACTSRLFDFISRDHAGKRSPIQGSARRMTTQDYDAIDDDNYTFRTLTPPSRMSHDDDDNDDDTLDPDHCSNGQGRGGGEVGGDAVANFWNTCSMESNGDIASDVDRKVAAKVNQKAKTKEGVARLLERDKKAVDSLDAGSNSDISEHLDEPISPDVGQRAPFKSPRVHQLTTSQPSFNGDVKSPSMEDKTVDNPLLFRESLTKSSLPSRCTPATTSHSPTDFPTHWASSKHPTSTATTTQYTTTTTTRISTTTSTTPSSSLHRPATSLAARQPSSARSSFARGSKSPNARHYAATAIQRWYRNLKVDKRQLKNEEDIRVSHGIYCSNIFVIFTLIPVIGECNKVLILFKTILMKYIFM